MKHPFSILLFGLLAALDIFLWTQIFLIRSIRPGAYFLNVGQGDSELVIFRDGVKVVTDAGPDDAVIGSIEKILPQVDTRIDLGIITHAQLDHFGGFHDLIKRYSFGAILWNGKEPEPETASWTTLKSEIHAKGIPLLEIEGGDSIKLDDDSIRILSPNAALWASPDLNDGCLTEKDDLGGTKMLFMCDAGFAVEEYLLSTGSVRADVLKVGHHGSKFSSNDLFLSAVDPQAAVIEVGAHNTYGHPSPEALSRLASSTQARIFRTDRNGTIRIIPAGSSLDIVSER